MSTQDLKPALCILNPDDVYNLKNNHAEDSYYCITPYEALEMQSHGITFPVEPHLQEGLVLTREPHGRGYYYRTDETDCRVINERCLAIEAILSYLGGKEFRYSETSSFRSKHSADIDVELGGKKSGIEVDNTTGVNTHTNQGEKGDKSVTAQWSGNYTQEGYLWAVKLAEVNGLNTDPTIAALLEQRRPSHPNPIASQEYHVNVTADLDKSIHVLEDISANLKDKVGGHLKVDVNTSRKVDQSATVDFFVSFGPIPVEMFQKPNEQALLGRPRRNSIKWLLLLILVFIIAGILLLLFVP